MTIRTPQTMVNFDKTLLPAVLLAVLICVPALGQGRDFRVKPKESSLEVINQVGTIRITAGAPGSKKVQINHKKVSGDAKIDYSSEDDKKIKVEVTGKGTVDFEIVVPPSLDVDLLSYKGAIFVSDLTGDIKARITTSGNITFTGMRSKKVEAHGSTGNVSFSGELQDEGRYTLKSFSGRIDATLPADSDFRLSASTFGGVIDLGGFAMKFERQTNQLVEASSGKGRASVKLWSQEGSIHLHRKP